MWGLLKIFRRADEQTSVPPAHAPEAAPESEVKLQGQPVLVGDGKFLGFEITQVGSKCPVVALLRSDQADYPLQHVNAFYIETARSVWRVWGEGGHIKIMSHSRGNLEPVVAALHTGAGRLSPFAMDDNIVIGTRFNVVGNLLFTGTVLRVTAVDETTPVAAFENRAELPASSVAARYREQIEHMRRPRI